MSQALKTDPHSDKVEQVTQELARKQAQIEGAQAVVQLEQFRHTTLTPDMVRFGVIKVTGIRVGGKETL